MPTPSSPPAGEECKGFTEEECRILVETELNKLARTFALERAEYEIARRSCEISKGALDYARWAFWVAIVSLLAPVIGMYIPAWSVKSDVESAQRSLLESKFTLTSINSGPIREVTPVGVTVQLGGRTPFPELNHYVVVTALDTGVDYVQPPAKVSVGGSWTGTATVGEGGTPPGTRFVIRCMATSSSLAGGVLPESEEALEFYYSQAAIVTR